MKKSILSIKGAEELNKDSQKGIQGGVTPNDCPSGCFEFFICPGDPSSNICAVPSPSGETCFGTHTGGQCCL